MQKHLLIKIDKDKKQKSPPKKNILIYIFVSVPVEQNLKVVHHSWISYYVLLKKRRSVQF